MPNYVSDGAWGTGLGVPLNVAQFDGNTYEFDTRISYLESNPQTPNGIASGSLNGTAFSFTLTEGQVLGPFPIPLPGGHWRGEYTGGQLYEALDEFSVAGTGGFLALLDHVTASTFDADAVGAAETAGAFVVGRTYVIATVGTTDFTLIGADSSTVGVEFKATGAGAGTGTATPKLYFQKSGVSTSTLIGDLANVDVTGAAANAMLVAVPVGSPATIEWQDRTPTQVTALLDVFEGAVGSPADDGLKGLVPAPTAADAAANRVLRADGTWGAGSTVAALDDLTDVSTGGAVVGSVLRASGSPIAWSPDLLSLDDLSDVALSSPAAGDFLRYDGGSPNGWTNEGGVAPSDLPAATLPLNLASLIEISEASGSPATYESKKLTIADLLDAGEITLGSTAIALGSTVTTIAGLTLTSPALSGTPTAPTAAPGTNNTQLATTAYADAAAAAIIAAADVMVFKGVIDCSANPNYPAADRGHTYRVSVAGKIGGGSGPNVEAGDLLICLTDGTAAGTHAAVGASWSIIQANLDGAVIGPASAVDSRIAAFDGTTGKLLKDGGIATSAILVSGGALGTPSSGTLTNATGLPVSTGISGLGSGVATFLGTPSSANLLAALTTKTGTGLNVFDTSPTISGLTLTGTTTLPDSGQITSAGLLGLGGAPASRLQLLGTFTTASVSYAAIGGTFQSSSTGAQTALIGNLTISPSGASVTSITGISFVPVLDSSSLNVANFFSNNSGMTLGASYSGAITTAITFRATSVVVNGGSVTTSEQFRAVTSTTNDGSTGTTTNRQFFGQGITAAAGAAGNMTNETANFTVPSGSSAGTTNYGLRITGNGGALSTNWAIHSSSTAASQLAGALAITAAGSKLVDQIYDHDLASTAQLDKTSNTTLALITGLSAPLVAGKTYNVEGWLSTTAGASGGLKVALVASGGLTATSARFQAFAFNGTTLVANTTVTALGSNIVANTAVITDVFIKGSVVVNAAGTIEVQAAQNASNGTTTSVFVGSIFSAKRIN